MQSLSTFSLFLFSYHLFSFIPWLMNSSDLFSYGSNLRKRNTLLSMCLGRNTPRIGGKAPFNSLRWVPYVLDKILQNGAKFIQKLAPGFKNHMRNLDNFRQAVESPKSWNMMRYFCPKTTFLRVKHIQRIYLTLLSTTCMKIHQIPYVIFETISHFSLHSSSVFKVHIFKLFYCLR